MVSILAPAERTIATGARVVVRPPLTFSDLMRVRIRAAMGVSQVEQTEGAPESTARTRPPDLFAIVRNKPRMASRVALFVAIAMLARLQARRTIRQGGYSTWLRDESSRGLS